MDLSAFIFVALAVAWAVYLIPKALKQHEDGAASRSIDGFSDRLRVLARRVPDSASTARLVIGRTRPERAATVAVALEATPTPAAEPEQPAAVSTPGQVAARRAAAARAATRRLRVVLVILLATAVVALLVLLGSLRPVALLAPVAVLAAWLLACRLMVTSERASEVVSPRTTASPAPVEEDDRSVVDDDDDGPLTEEFAFVHVEADLVVPVVAARDLDEDVAEPAGSAQRAVTPTSSGWDPVPVTLPTYVGKEPAARRTVRTIDLDSTGVWTSGPLAADSELAREADEAERTAKADAQDAADAHRRRASGS